LHTHHTYAEREHTCVVIAGPIDLSSLVCYDARALETIHATPAQTVKAIVRPSSLLRFHFQLSVIPDMPLYGRIGGLLPGVGRFGTYYNLFDSRPMYVIR
jgi:hypothetical protein